MPRAVPPTGFVSSTRHGVSLLTSISRTIGIVLATVSALMLSPGVANAQASTDSINYAFDEQAHEAYRAAVKALKKKNKNGYQKHAAKLKNHPLYPFAEYQRLKRRISSLSSEQIDEFKNTYGHAVVSSLLENHYRGALARRGEWREYVARTEGAKLSTADRCVRIRARLKTGEDMSALDDEIEKLWLAGKSQPDECDPVFKAWNAAGNLTTERVFNRIELCVARGNGKLAKYLGNTYLSKPDQKWVQRWLTMRANPKRELNKVTWKADSSTVAGPIIRLGMQRALLRDMDNAKEHFDRWNAKFQLDEANRAAVVYKLGMNAAVDHHTDAAYWLSQLPPAYHTATSRAWRVRASLRQGQIEQAGKDIEHLTADERSEPKWQYWKGRALAAAGNQAEASEIFSRLATTRNYYGFLAADLLDLPYKMNQTGFDSDSDDIQKTLRREDLVMAMELKALGEVQMARRQWRYASKTMTPDELRNASIAAHLWQWHDRAIITAGKSGHTNDLDVRFPILYRPDVDANAKRNQIPVQWVYGVIRQESAFMTDARSGVGALGLMQLMPATARRVAKRLKLKGIKSRASIVKPKTNIKLGTTYLRSVLDRMNGHLVLATASYNAGPHKVERWLPVDASLAADVWIETIPYKETRNFVKNVLGFMAVYGYRLNGETRSIKERLRTVTPNDS